jgi:hypothetical protein
MEWQANKPTKEIFIQANWDYTLRHLINSIAPLLELSQVKKDYNA